MVGRTRLFFVTRTIRATLSIIVLQSLSRRRHIHCQTQGPVRPKTYSLSWGRSTSAATATTCLISSGRRSHAREILVTLLLCVVDSSTITFNYVLLTEASGPKKLKTAYSLTLGIYFRVSFVNILRHAGGSMFPSTNSNNIDLDYCPIAKQSSFLFVYFMNTRYAIPLGINIVLRYSLKYGFFAFDFAFF